MSTLRFSDGVAIDTSGDYRTLRLPDGWYVVGNGLCCPCRGESDAIKLRDELKKNVSNQTSRQVP
ncbi:hypothetical protein [Steroidobacter agaridevorans]|uniref:hypothetical protein n=1 Tax=Steroidobacter agaridevorans TaxID=2695856 RepID=UPI00137B600E|nr:hypothetical protein [Steroidobacter agaridevorans]